MTADAGAHRPTYATERLSALSDGVFSIVLTLLVLELKVPDVPAGDERALIVALEKQIPHFVAWLISFVLVARFWIVHHAIVATLGRCHLATMMWNFVVLALMSLVPFAAALIGTYEFDGVAVLIFAILMGLAGLSLGLFARHAATESHLHRDADGGTNLQWQWKYHSRVLPGVAAVSILLLGVEELAALVIWGFEPVIAFLGSFKRRR